MSWNKIIQENIGYSLSDADIKNICENKVKIISYEQLKNVQSIDELLNPFDAVVILYQFEKYSGHWVSCMKYGNTIELFGSYGLDVDEQLSFSDYDKLQHGGIAVPYLTQLLSKTSYRILHNHTKLQSDKKDVATCGRYAALRIRLRNLSLETFVNLFTKATGLSNDEWVTSLTILFS
jgi:hypothetical protein